MSEKEQEKKGSGCSFETALVVIVAILALAIMAVFLSQNLGLQEPPQQFVFNMTQGMSAEFNNDVKAEQFNTQRDERTGDYAAQKSMPQYQPQPQQPVQPESKGLLGDMWDVGVDLFDGAKGIYGFFFGGE